MLVLSRKNRESVVIGGAPSVQPVLRVTVLEIRGGKVKLGFEADPSISVQRSEVWERIHTGELPEEHTDEPTPKRSPPTSPGRDADQEGMMVEGRPAIEESLAAFFTENPGCWLKLNIVTIRLVSPGVAIEDGPQIDARPVRHPRARPWRAIDRKLPALMRTNVEQISQSPCYYESIS